MQTNDLLVFYFSDVQMAQHIHMRKPGNYLLRNEIIRSINSARDVVNCLLPLGSHDDPAKKGMAALLSMAKETAGLYEPIAVALAEVRIQVTASNQIGRNMDKAMGFGLKFGNFKSSTLKRKSDNISL